MARKNQKISGLNNTDFVRFLAFIGVFLVIAIAFFSVGLMMGIGGGEELVTGKLIRASPVQPIAVDRSVCGNGILESGEGCELGNPPGVDCSWSECDYDGCTCTNEADVSCYDSDGGINYLVKGTCRSVYGDAIDHCSSGLLSEYYCNADNDCSIQSEISCQENYGPDYYCKNGVCTNAPVYHTG